MFAMDYCLNYQVCVDVSSNWISRNHLATYKRISK